MTKRDRRTVRRYFIALLLAMTPCVTSGHAVVVESSPVDGAQLRAAPQAAELRFNVHIEQSLARANLHVAGRDPIALTPLRGNSRRTARLVVPLPQLAAGAYELRYQVLAVDGHTTQGVLRFRVSP